MGGPAPGVAPICNGSKKKLAALFQIEDVMYVYAPRVGETLTPVEVTVADSHVDFFEDIQRRLKKQEKYRESCSAVTGSNTARATTVPKSMLFPVARQSMINDGDIITNERTNDDQTSHFITIHQHPVENNDNIITNHRRIPELKIHFIPSHGYSAESNDNNITNYRRIRR